jgi:aspartyl-tRNA(Asn)/glutamyl-tRNA(Gln) amidotransferase subunit A
MDLYMLDLTKLSLATARKALDKKEFTAVELTQSYLSAMEKARGLNAYVLETPQKALNMAKQSDERLAKGQAGTLEGHSPWH